MILENTMKNLVKESIEEFKRGQEPQKGLNIGRGSAEMAEKREEERQARIILSEKCNWNKKPSNLSEVHNKNYGATLVTDGIMQLLEDGAVEEIPMDDYYLKENIYEDEVPEKYRMDIFLVWDEEEGFQYLIDTSGYNYPRYLTVLVMQEEWDTL